MTVNHFHDAFAFWGYLPVKSGKLLTLVFTVMIIAMYISSVFLESIPQFVFDNTDVFEEYTDTYANAESDVHFGLGFIIYLIPLIISILYHLF